MKKTKDLPELLEKLAKLKIQAEQAIKVTTEQKEVATKSQKKFEEAVRIVLKLANCESHEVSTIKKMAEVFASENLEGFEK